MIEDGQEVMEKRRTIALLEQIVAVACELINDPSKRGGYFCRTSNGQVIFHEQIGEMPIEKTIKHRIISLEKAVRLMMGTLLNNGHVLSRQSCDPGKLQWGGGIVRCSGVVDSFTGFSEVEDEACMLVLYVVEDGSRDANYLFENVASPFAKQLLTEWNRRHPGAGA